MVVNSVIADNRFSLRLLANLIAYCKYLHFQLRKKGKAGRKEKLLLDI